MGMRTSQDVEGGSDLRSREGRGSQGRTAPGQASGAGMCPRAGPCAGTVGPNWAGAESSGSNKGKAAGPARLRVHSGQQKCCPPHFPGRVSWDSEPRPEDQQRELREAGDLKTGGSKGPEGVWVEGQRRAESKGQDLRQEGPRTELLQGEGRLEASGHLASPGLELSPGNKGVRRSWARVRVPEGQRAGDAEGEPRDRAGGCMSRGWRQGGPGDLGKQVQLVGEQGLG